MAFTSDNLLYSLLVQGSSENNALFYIGQYVNRPVFVHIRSVNEFNSEDLEKHKSFINIIRNNNVESYIGYIEDDKVYLEELNSSKYINPILINEELKRVKLVERDFYSRLNKFIPFVKYGGYKKTGLEIEDTNEYKDVYCKDIHKIIVYSCHSNSYIELLIDIESECILYAAYINYDIHDYSHIYDDNRIEPITGNYTVEIDPDIIADRLETIISYYEIELDLS
jgi:hypothetical protein